MGKEERETGGGADPVEAGKEPLAGRARAFWSGTGAFSLRERPLLLRTVALTCAIWCVHAVLRAFQLGRPAPYGAPFVEKFDWYFFHAMAFDALWTLPWMVPLLLYYGLGGNQSRGRAHAWPFWIAAVLHAIYLLLVVIDQEMMRFMAVHANLERLGTYLNLSAAADVPAMIRQDEGGAYLPLVLLFGAPLLQLFLTAAFARVLSPGRLPARAIWISLVLFPIAGWLLVSLWGGSFRERKLRPLIATVISELGKPRVDSLKPDEYRRFRDSYRHLWSSASPRRWVFPRPDYPFFRMTLERACREGLISDRECALDGDGDGYPTREDCHDGSAEQHPEAAEIASNGVDEDCDGVDAQPWNVVLVLLESHRALNTGHLLPHGAREAASSFLDLLASRGDFWTRHSVNGLPTIEAFFAAHCSIYAKGIGHAATGDTTDRFDCLPSVLRRYGYRSHFVTATAPDWDNQTFWLARWYDGYHFDRSRQTDLSLFRWSAGFLRRLGREPGPFFVTLLTKSNHVPFNAVDDMTAVEKAATPNNINTTMGYAERALRELFQALRREPWFGRTLFIITGDHGINLGEHGAYSMGDALHRASTWVPLVIAGEHPELQGAGSAHRHITSHTDIAPTVLDLLGMEPPVAWVGHSMLPGGKSEEAYALAAYGEDIAFERHGLRSLVSQVGVERRGGDQLFDAVRDFHEHDDLSGKGEPYRRQLAERRSLCRGLQRLTWHALENDLIYPQYP